MERSLIDDASDDMIVIESLDKSFKLVSEKKNSFSFNRRNHTTEDFFALKNINLSVKKGECLGIIGRNGCGKTTLLKVIAGIYGPTNGRVIANGKVMSFLELGVGFEPELTGRENIFLYGSVIGLERRDIEKKLAKVIDYSQLGKFIDSKLKTYSSGMQVRLAFAAAMMNEPDIFLIDEVLAVGDESFQKKSFEKIKELKKQGKTLIVVSHSMDHIKKLCDSVIVMDSGEIIMEGSSDNCIRYYLENVSREDICSLLSRIEKIKSKIIETEQPISKPSKRKMFLNYFSKDSQRKKELLSDKTEALLELTKEVKHLAYTKLEQLDSYYDEADSDLVISTKLELYSSLKKALRAEIEYGAAKQKKLAVENLKSALAIEDQIHQNTNLMQKGVSIQPDAEESPLLQLQEHDLAQVNIKKIISVKNPSVEFEVSQNGSVTKTEITKETVYHVNECFDVNKGSIPREELKALLFEQYKISEPALKKKAFDELLGFLELQIKQSAPEKRLYWLFELQSFLRSEIISTAGIKEKRSLINTAGHHLRVELEAQERRFLSLNLEKERLSEDLADSKSSLGVQEAESAYEERLSNLQNKISECNDLINHLVNYQIELYSLDTDSNPRVEGKHDSLGWGSHEAKIIGVRFLDSIGEEKSVFVSGEKFVAEISYSCRDEIKNPMFGVAIHTESGVHVCGPNSTFSSEITLNQDILGNKSNVKSSLPVIKGKGKIQFVIDSLPMQAGAYLFSASIYDYLGTYPFDHHYKKYRFHIVNQKLSGNHGILSINCSWNLLN